MTVVINEFEIFVEPEKPSGGGGGGATASPAGPAQGLAPQDVVQIEDWHRTRMSRVDAD